MSDTPQCGSFGCTLPRGHNRGQADVPENHRPADPVRCTDRPDDPPHKRLRLKLDLEAHDLEDLTARLYDILTRLDVDGSEQTRRISGSYTLDLTCDPDMTEERFVAELDAWSQRRKEARTDA